MLRLAVLEHREVVLRQVHHRTLLVADDDVHEDAGGRGPNFGPGCGRLDCRHRHRRGGDDPDCGENEGDALNAIHEVLRACIAIRLHGEGDLAHLRGRAGSNRDLQRVETTRYLAQRQAADRDEAAVLLRHAEVERQLGDAFVGDEQPDASLAGLDPWIETSGSANEISGVFDR